MAEIKVYINPPNLVIKVVAAVQILLGASKPDWPSAKILLSDPMFLTRLINIDKDNISEKVCLPTMGVGALCDGVANGVPQLQQT